MINKTFPANDFMDDFGLHEEHLLFHPPLALVSDKTAWGGDTKVSELGRTQGTPDFDRETEHFCRNVAFAALEAATK